MKFVKIQMINICILLLSYYLDNETDFYVDR